MTAQILPAQIGLQPNRWLWVNGTTGEKYASAIVKVNANSDLINMVTWDDETGETVFHFNVRHQSKAAPGADYWIVNDGSDYVNTSPATPPSR